MMFFPSSIARRARRLTTCDDRLVVTRDVSGRRVQVVDKIAVDELPLGRTPVVPRVEEPLVGGEPRSLASASRGADVPHAVSVLGIAERLRTHSRPVRQMRHAVTARLLRLIRRVRMPLGQPVEALPQAFTRPRGGTVS
jgi:hypothetical protein